MTKQDQKQRTQADHSSYKRPAVVLIISVATDSFSDEYTSK